MVGIKSVINRHALIGRVFGWTKERLEKAHGQKTDIGLAGLNLAGMDLRNADLRRANLKGTNLNDARLQGATLIGADLRGADLSASDLRGAKLTEADPDMDWSRKRHWWLNEGPLRADLRGAILYNADLRNTDLCAADWRGANMTGARLPVSYKDKILFFDDKTIDLKYEIMDVAQVNDEEILVCFDDSKTSGTEYENRNIICLYVNGEIKWVVKRPRGDLQKNSPFVGLYVHDDGSVSCFAWAGMRYFVNMKDGTLKMDQAYR